MANLEDALQKINAKYVRLSDDEKKRNNSKLNEVLTLITEKMKKTDKLFNALHSRNHCFAGSYYDGLKVSHPNEYDIDILLDLPKLSYPDLKPSAKAGYVSVSITLEEINRQNLEDFRGLSKLLDEDNYVSIAKVNQWFEGLVQKAINFLNGEGKLIKMKKSGPAKTVTVSVNGYNFNEFFDIDLVPCFFFTTNDWPSGYKRINTSDGFFIVPKPLKSGSNRFWRASFQCQEKELIKDIGRIKPALRLIKVLRDKQNIPLKSYFIKTVVLWELEGGESYSTKTLSFTYLKMLKSLHRNMQEKKINFYWDKDLNLLEDWNAIQCSNVADRLQRMINKIETNPIKVWDYYGSADLPPTYADANGSGSEDTAIVNNNWGMIGGIAAGVAALGVAAVATYAIVRNRQRDNN